MYRESCDGVRSCVKYLQHGTIMCVKLQKYGYFKDMVMSRYTATNTYIAYTGQDTNASETTALCIRWYCTHNSRHELCCPSKYKSDVVCIVLKTHM